MRGDAGRCGVACMRACPWAPCHAQRLPLWGKITSFSKRPSFFGKITQNLWARQRRARQQRRARHAAKAWHAAKAHGMQPRPRHAAPQGHGGMLPRPRQPPWHAAKAKDLSRAPCTVIFVGLRLRLGLIKLEEAVIARGFCLGTSTTARVGTRQVK